MALERSITPTQPAHSPAARLTSFVLAHPGLLLLVTALGLALAITNWWIADDYDFAIPKPPEQVAGFFLFQRNRIFYRPLSWTTFAFDYNTWGWHNPLPSHLINIAIHLISLILVWQLVRRLAQSELAAGLAALFFAAMPPHPGAIAWVQGRADLLSTMLYLATAVYFAAYLRERRLWLYLLAAFSLLLAIMSKEVAMTAPAVLLAADLLLFPQPELAQRPRQWLRFIFVKLRLHLIFIILGVGYAVLRVLLALLHYVPLGYTEKPATLQQFLDNIGGYLAILCGVANIYSVRGPTATVFVFSFVAISLLLAWYGGRLGWFGVAWLVITLLPVMLVNVIASDGRYLYLPSIGFAILLATAMRRLFETIVRLTIAPPTRRILTTITLIFTLLLIGYAVASTITYREEYRLTSDISQRLPATLTAAHPTVAPNSRIFIAHLPYEYKRVIIWGAGVSWAIRMAYDYDLTAQIYFYEPAPQQFVNALNQNQPNSYYYIWQGDVASGTLHEVASAQEMLKLLDSP